MEHEADLIAMYIVVRESVTMSPGKFGGQVGHAVMLAMAHYAVLSGVPVAPSSPVAPSADLDLDMMRAWLATGYTKILLSADEKEWARAKTMPGATVATDLGRTELEPNTETVLALWPMRRSARPGWFRRLRLLAPTS
jgi:peptidyl-tRNA hydrolase